MKSQPPTTHANMNTAAAQAIRSSLPYDKRDELLAITEIDWNDRLAGWWLTVAGKSTKLVDKYKKLNPRPPNYFHFILWESGARST
jgi:hypothetical protein